MFSLFSCSSDLFRLNDGSQIKFVILESSSDSSLVARLIEFGGGSSSIEQEPLPNVINLCCYSKPWMKNFEIFNTAFIYACCRTNKKLSLHGYSMGKNFSENEYRKLSEKYLYSGKEQMAFDKCIQVDESSYQISINKDDSFSVMEEGSEHRSSRNSSKETHSRVSKSPTSSKPSFNRCTDLKDGEEECFSGIEEASLPAKSTNKNSCLSAESNVQAEKCSNSPSLDAGHKESLPLHSLLERKIKKILPANTKTYDKWEVDNMEIYPNDSVSQAGKSIISSESSSLADLTNDSVWEKKSSTWVADTEESD